MKKRTASFFLFVLICFLFVFLLPVNFSSAAEPKALEIVYPKIPGVNTPEVVSMGLPDYVEYIFRLAIWLIGFLIFGVMVYNGVNYLLSVGNPAKMANARSGILAGFLGGLVLLSTYIIFNTINPQLVIFEPAEIQVLGGIIRPGVYLCNYSVVDIDSILADYIDGDIGERTEAAEKLKEDIGPKENGNVCLKVESSGNFRDFDFKGKDHNSNTWFMVPALSGYNLETNRYEGDPEFDYGIVLHEKDNFGGQCYLLLSYDPSSFAIGSQSDFHLTLPFNPKSVHLFQRLPSEDRKTQGTVTLYSQVRFNEEVKAGEDRVGRDFPSLQEILEIREGDLQVATTTLSKNTRSIKIEGSVFALLFENNNFGGKCELIKNSDSNLEDNPIGRCGAGCYIIAGWFVDCQPCLKSMISVKGTVF